MRTFEERCLIYTALLIVCATAGALTSWQAGFWTLVQIACAVELLNWLGVHASSKDTGSNR
jgi:hypothetical protein